MEIFDCHLHIEKDFDKYDLKLLGANIIFNSIESYNKNASNFSNYYHSLIFDLNQPTDYFNSLLEEKKIRALKIHSRLQKITCAGHDEIILKLQKLKYNVPVIYDAFYYGSDLDFQPSLSGLISLIKAFPDKKFIVAHAGGYQLLKYFFHLKELENSGFDLSFSLQYLSDSSCALDLIKLLRYIPQHRLFFGTDFPFASPSNQLKIFNNLVTQAGISEQNKNNILSSNWLNFTKNYEDLR